MNKKPPHGDHQHEQSRHRAARRGERRCYSEDIDRDQAAEPDENIVDWMSPRADQEINLRRVVVDGMEPPEQGNFVGPSMAPIEADLTHCQSRQRARPDRQGGDRGVQAVRNELVRSDSNEGHWRSEQKSGYQATNKIKADIAGQALAEEFARMQRRQPL